jgi:pimeloyl-ACP methyl ester carboxylesterase
LLGASAICGDAYNPEWVFRLSFNEGEVPVTTSSGDTVGMFVRVVGDEPKEKAGKVRPLLVIPGGPGLPHEYLETLEAVAKTNRRVLEFDPLGTGRSAFPAIKKPAKDGEDGEAAAALSSRLMAVVANPEAVAAQAAVAANAAFGVGVRHHVLGHGTGAAAALLYAAACPTAVASLTLASPVLGRPPQASFPWRGDDPNLRGALDRPNLAAPSGSSGNGSNISGGNKRIALFPICLEDAVLAGNGALYLAWQPATPKDLEAAATVMGRSGPIPTLLTSGAKDFAAVLSSLAAATELLRAISAAAPLPAASPAAAALAAKAATQRSVFIPGCEGAVAVTQFSESGHMAHLDEREKFLAGLFTFLEAADNDLK